MRNAALDAAVRTLQEAGVHDYEIAKGSKHLQIRWRANGGQRFYALGSTPSDWRAPHNVRAEIRRMLKNDGLLTTPEPERPAPPRPPTLEQRVTRLEEFGCTIAITQLTTPDYET